MTQRPARLALMAGLVAGLAAIPLAGHAQQKKQAAPAQAAPARAAPAAPHQAPHIAAPHPVQRMAVPHMQMNRAATPHLQFRRAATPQPHRTVAAPTQHFQVNRSVQRHERAVQHQERAARRHEHAVQRQAQHASPKLNAAQTQTTRAQQRAERLQRRREDRALRNTPKSQRAAKREEIRRAREQRAQQRQQQAHPNAALTTNATQGNKQTRTQRATRQANRVTPQAARAGRFAARFASLSHAQRHRHHYAAWRAWRHGLRAAFVAWYGPVFWPYAYSDIFDYTFWPYGYEEGYWDFAYDDFIDSLFWGEAGPPAEYVYGDAAPGSYAQSAPSVRVRQAMVAQLCQQPGTGVTAWPFTQIEQKLDLTADQKNLLEGVREAAKDAAATFKASCPANDAFPLTPPGRLQAMTARLQATLQAVETVKPALDKFYSSLSDEQKERFNELGPKHPANNVETTAALPADSKSCSEPKPGLTNLPIERIGDAVNPNDAQDAKLTALQDATDKAVSILQAACPEETPVTPPGRLDAMETRLKAMIQAANTVKPALVDFYASLSSEQKARFNEIGKEVASKS